MLYTTLQASSTRLKRYHHQLTTTAVAYIPRQLVVPLLGFKRKTSLTNLHLAWLLKAIGENLTRAPNTRPRRLERALRLAGPGTAG